MPETDGPSPKNPPGESEPPETDGSPVDHYTTLLQGFLQELSAALKELEKEVPKLTVSMKQRPDRILSMLPQMLEFEQMSFLELRYSPPGPAKKRPGIRFWLEGPQKEKQLRAILFEDTRAWDVSYDLEKLYTELGRFLLQGSEIVAHPEAALSGKPAEPSDWRACLRILLRAPISSQADRSTD